MSLKRWALDRLFTRWLTSSASIQSWLPARFIPIVGESSRSTLLRALRGAPEPPRLLHHRDKRVFSGARWTALPGLPDRLLSLAGYHYQSKQRRVNISWKEEVKIQTSKICFLFFKYVQLFLVKYPNESFLKTCNKSWEHLKNTFSEWNPVLSVSIVWQAE